MKARHWSLAIILILVNYLIFASLFTRLMEADFSLNYATRTPIPTFTPAPAQPFIVVPTLTPVPPEPTPTATRVIAPANNNSEARTNETSPADNQNTGTVSSELGGNQPRLVAPGPVNIRSGPGLTHDIIGTLNANTPMPVVGRNADASWWQIRLANDTTGWVAGSVVNTNNTDQVPLVDIPAAPANSSQEALSAEPAASFGPAPPEKPKYQFEPTGWYDDTNEGLTRFLGDIVDVNGNPVDGVFVQASCGDYSVISFPSGPVGWGPLNEGATWPPGFYDLMVDSKPVPCIWTLAVVETDDRKTVKSVLSEAIPVEVTMEKSIIVAGWRKNW